MSFFGRAFTFDSTPCELFDLMLYDIGDQDTEIPVAGVSTIEDESVGDHWRPYFYGVRPGEKLEFDITFGVNERRLDEHRFLDRWELAEVTAWLCGHTEYKWLYVDQPDMKPIGYKCMISELTVTRYGSVPWALKAHVTCDSPYAYLEETAVECEVNGTETIEIFNESSLNGWYYPVVSFELSGGTSFSVKNEEDNDKGPSFTDIPSSVSLIRIDNEHCIIENDQDLNLYSGFNFQFLRLKRGYNHITITGNGTATILCEYPVNVGG